MLGLFVFILPGCVTGIPDRDGWNPPPPPPPCKPIKVDDVERACLDDIGLQKWMNRNLPHG